MGWCGNKVAPEPPGGGPSPAPGPGQISQHEALRLRALVAGAPGWGAAAASYPCAGSKLQRAAFSARHLLASLNPLPALTMGDLPIAWFQLSTELLVFAMLVAPRWWVLCGCTWPGLSTL